MSAMPLGKIVIFLGAGFSFDAGLPLMSAFGSHSQEDHKNLSRYASTGEKYAARWLAEAGTAFFNFQEICRRSPTLKPAEVDNIETIFCIAEAMSEAGISEIPLTGGTCTPDKLIEKLQLWIWKIYQQCPLIDEDAHRREDGYNNFFSVLAPRWDRITVISTNYDLVFEYMSWRNGVSCAYPFSENSDRVQLINAGYGSKQYVHANSDDSKTPVVICKLHGSVNFFEDASKKDDPTLFIATDLGDKKPIGKSFNFNDKPAVFAVDAIWKIRKDHGESFTPAIIPPSYAKLGRKPWLVDIWKHAFNALSTARTVVFIGYSMPPTDGFMRALVHGAMAIGNETRERRIFVIDPCPDVHEGYSTLFGTSYCNVGYHTLESALKANVLASL